MHLASQILGKSLTAVLDVLPIPVWRRDGELTLVNCNTAYSELLERMRDDVLGNHLERGAYSIYVKGHGHAARAQKTGIMLSESHYVGHGGERHLFKFNAVPLGTPGGVGHAMDVSALEQIQSNLSSHIATHGEVLESLATKIAYIELWDIEPSDLPTGPLIGELLELIRERCCYPDTSTSPRSAGSRSGCSSLCWNASKN